MLHIIIMSGLILGLHPANDRRCYKVAPSLIHVIGWAQTLGCFKIQKFLSCIVAFYSPVMHAKGNSHAKFQQNRCAFGPPRRSFSISASAGSKNAIFTIHKKSKLS